VRIFYRKDYGEGVFEIKINIFLGDKKGRREGGREGERGSFISSIISKSKRR
jgi:hypothetical protein